MSGNSYGYYYAPNAQSFPVDPNQTWNEWPGEQPQYSDTYSRSAVQNASSYNAPPRPGNFYNNNNNRHYQQRRFNNPHQPFQQQNNWQRNNYNKRPRPQDSPGDSTEPKSKATKKKKKPLSQNIPSKKDWTMEEAETALAVEKEYNKRYKNHSLIIKFPDLELNRDIVSKFHPSIENVHFQQPSTPRFCFVTLQESADAESVISALNKIKFGEGYLTAEYKKDREEDQNIGPEDIDPCTLYVGNLAQEITKEDMVRTYPKGRRIDIGYAKKMKYTRYAFVSFKNVQDSIEAFKQTHSTQMYSKSLIVRFRRLHGTVGMPGESKPQSPAKSKADAQPPPAEKAGHEANASAPSVVDLSVVKQEVNSSDEERYESPFMPGSISLAFEQHRPMVKKEVKQEFEEDSSSMSSTLSAQKAPGEANGVRVKQEIVKDERLEEEDDSSDDDCGGDGDVNFSSLLNQLEDHSNQIESLRKSSCP